MMPCLIVSAEVTGGDGSFQYDWGDGFQRYAGFMICPKVDTTIPSSRSASTRATSKY